MSEGLVWMGSPRRTHWARAQAEGGGSPCSALHGPSPSKRENSNRMEPLGAALEGCSSTSAMAARIVT